MKSLVQSISEKLQISRNKNNENNVWNAVVKHKFWDKHSRFYPNSMVGHCIYVISKDVSPRLHDGEVEYFKMKTGNSPYLEMEVKDINGESAYLFIRSSAEFLDWFGEGVLEDILSAMDDLV